MDQNLFLVRAFIGFLLIVHLFIASRTQSQINRADFLVLNQKRANSLLIWLIPYIGSYIVIEMIKIQRIKEMTKAERNNGQSHPDLYYHSYTYSWKGGSGKST